MLSRVAIVFTLVIAVGGSSPLLAGSIPCETSVSNECTTAPTCQADGSCSGTPAREGQPCTEDTTSGGCMTNPVCQNGVCMGMVEAPDGTPCTQDISGGCMTNPFCQSGICLGTVAAPAGTPCTIAGLEKCFTAQCSSPVPGFSICLPGGPKTCPPVSDPCKQSVCNPQTGDCVAGDKCFTFSGCEVCNAGTCNPTNIGGKCTNPEGDFNPCTTNDHCALLSLGAAASLPAFAAPSSLPAGLAAAMYDARQGGQTRGICMGDAGVGPNPTATPGTGPTPTPTVGSVSCVGDCNLNFEVTVDELITMVNIALGNAQVSACVPGDANGDGEITINEIVSAVNHALNGCAG